MRVTTLGTGTSCGVPVLGCQCAVCRSTDSHDKRLRCVALVETETTRLLIDCGPDIRQQLLGVPFRKIDGVLLTHEHYDHVGGMDDLRPYCQFGDIPVYGLERTLLCVKHNMPYCFPDGQLYPGVPRLSLNTITPHQPLTIGDISIMPIVVMHGTMPILGFRMGDFAYITDMKSINASEIPQLYGVRMLVVNALRYAPVHHSHQLVDDAVRFASEIGAEQTWLTHSSHEIGLHAKVQRRLPHGISMAYDGLVIDV